MLHSIIKRRVPPAHAFLFFLENIIQRIQKQIPIDIVTLLRKMHFVFHPNILTNLAVIPRIRWIGIKTGPCGLTDIEAVLIGIAVILQELIELLGKLLPDAIFDVALMGHGIA